MALKFLNKFFNSKYFLFFIILLSFSTIFFSLQYVTQGRNSMIIPYCRVFTAPEHGRYFATFLYSFFVEKLPFYLKINFNDIIFYIMLFILAPINLFILGLVAKGIDFCGQKRKFFVFSITFLLLFCLFFNTYIRGYEFLGLTEFVEVFEYNNPLIFYLLWCFVFLKYFLRWKVPTKKGYILIAILTFLTGISTESLNLFFLTFLGLLTVEIFFISKISKRSEIWNFFKFIFSLCCVYALSLIVYYVHPADHSIVWGNNNSNFFLNFSQTFYSEIIKPYFYLPLISIFLSLCIFFSRKYHRTVDNLVLTFSVTNLISLYIFYYFGNYFIMSVWESNSRYWLFMDKFQLVFLIIIAFNIILQLGYLLNSRFTNKKSFIIKCLILLSCFVFIKGIHPVTYWQKLKECRTYRYEQRLLLYQFIKTVLEQKNQKIIFIPNEDEKYKYLDLNIKDTLSTLSFIQGGYFYKTDVVVLSSNKKYEALSEEEKKHLRFSNLIIPVIPDKCFKEKQYEIKYE